jgi:glyoxylase-like metal-dependent hydrolase (beta-lactamase superfamily II)
MTIRRDQAHVTDEIYSLPRSIEGVHDITVRQLEAGRRFRSYLLDWDVPTLFDTGFQDTTEELLAGIEETGLVPERVIITHEDPDHTGGLSAVTDEYAVETWAPAADADAIASEWNATVDREYEDGDEIGPWRAIHCAGHTPGASVLLDEEEGIAVTGDVVFGADVRGLPAGYLVTPPEYYSADVAAAERNLETLLDHEFEIALVSHGTAVIESASEKLERYVQFPGKPPVR